MILVKNIRWNAVVLATLLSQHGCSTDPAFDVVEKNPRASSDATEKQAEQEKTSRLEIMPEKTGENESNQSTNNETPATSTEKPPENVEKPIPEVPTTPETRRWPFGPVSSRVRRGLGLHSPHR